MERIVVGVDGSETAKRAVDWAMSHATGEDVVVLAHTWAIPAVAGFEMPVSSLADYEVAAHRLVKDMAAEIEVEGGPKIEVNVGSGHPGQRLADLSADADLIVVGSRGYGGVRGLMLGSVSNHVVHHAKCPTVVVR